MWRINLRRGARWSTSPGEADSGSLSSVLTFPSRCIYPGSTPVSASNAAPCGVDEREVSMSIAAKIIAAAALAALAISGAHAQESYASWPPLQSTFESTGGNGIMIKGYDPVILRDKCVTTFMAVTPAPDVNVYFNVIEFEATQVQGGTLCANGKWRSMDGSATGTTPFRMFFKDGTFRRAP